MGQAAFRKAWEQQVQLPCGAQQAWEVSGEATPRVSLWGAGIPGNAAGGGGTNEGQEGFIQRWMCEGFINVLISERQEERSTVYIWHALCMWKKRK